MFSWQTLIILLDTWMRTPLHTSIVSSNSMDFTLPHGAQSQNHITLRSQTSCSRPSERIGSTSNPAGKRVKFNPSLELVEMLLE